MILLHRITPAVLAAVVAAGFSFLIFFEGRLLIASLLLLLIVPLILGRLLKWDVKRMAFWMFLGVPTLFAWSSVFFFLFLEQDFARLLLAIFVLISTWLYAENLFTFYHLPGSYQAYSLEYLSLMLSIATAFFFTSGAYGTQLFLQLPVWVPSLAVFWVVLFLSTAVFWASKIAHESAVRFSVAAAIIMTQLYIAFAMLPTSFMSNAAGFAVALYVLLGISRAHVLEKLSKTVLTRYLVIGGFFLLVVFGTAKWV